MDILGTIHKIRRWARGEHNRCKDNLKFAHDDRTKRDYEQQVADFGSVLELAKRLEEMAKRGEL